MIKILIIEKEDIKEDTNEGIDNLYKKCRFKKSEDFQEIETFNYKKINIKLFGKLKGKSNNKYTYKFREIEKTIYGPCCVIALKDKQYIDINKELFKDFLDNKILEDQESNQNNEKNKENEENEENVENEENDEDDEDDEEDKESEYGGKDNQEKDEVEIKDEDDQEELYEENEEDEENEYSDDEEIKKNNEQKIDLDIGDDLNNFSGSELAEEKYIYSSEEEDY